MSYETFARILLNEGVTPEGVLLLWQSRDTDDLVETRLRYAANKVREVYPQYFVQQNQKKSLC